MKIKYKIKLQRKGKTIEQKRTKNVKITGVIIEEPKRGTFTNRFGRQVDGLKIIYRRNIPKGAGRDGRIKSMKLEKIVAIPKNAYDVKRFV